MVCMAAGCSMGKQLNKSNDALHFYEFYEKWINTYLLRDQAPQAPEQLGLMVEHFQACLSRFLASSERFGSWGWKNPRSMLVLPFLHAFFSELRFIHVVRDGRDIAYSKNQNQLRKHGEALLGAKPEGLSEPMQSIAFWSKANMLAARYGEEEMGDYYLRCKFEDMCWQPKTTVEQIADFLKSQIEDESSIVEAIKVPDSIGVWRNEQMAEQTKLTGAGLPGLRYFGYLT